MEKNEIILLDDTTIKDLIYEIRGQKVMLDFDLARIYGYETKRFNEQVKNNINKFPEDFRFELSNDELQLILRSKKSATNKISSKRRYNPYAFTEQGIYMLMTVLKGELATKQSLALIRLFRGMKDYIVETNNLITTNEVLKLSKQVDENTRKISTIENKLDIVMDNFIDSSTYKQFVIFNGCKIEGSVALQSIYSLAKQSLIIVDDYISLKTLELLLVCDKDIQITICSDNAARNKLTDIELADFMKESKFNIKMLPTNKKVHDRCIIVDYKTDNDSIFLSSPSSKDVGGRIGTIIKTDDRNIYHPIIDQLLNN